MTSWLTLGVCVCTDLFLQPKPTPTRYSKPSNWSLSSVMKRFFWLVDLLSTHYKYVVPPISIRLVTNPTPIKRLCILSVFVDKVSVRLPASLKRNMSILTLTYKQTLNWLPVLIGQAVMRVVLWVLVLRCNNKCLVKNGGFTDDNCVCLIL